MKKQLYFIKRGVWKQCVCIYWHCIRCQPCIYITTLHSLDPRLFSPNAQLLVSIEGAIALNCANPALGQIVRIRVLCWGTSSSNAFFNIFWSRFIATSFEPVPQLVIKCQLLSYQLLFFIKKTFKVIWGLMLCYLFCCCCRRYCCFFRTRREN